MCLHLGRLEVYVKLIAALKALSGSLVEVSPKLPHPKSRSLMEVWLKFGGSFDLK